MSAITKWYKRLGSLAEQYNVLATVHCWMNNLYRQELSNNPDIYFIKDYEIMKYIFIFDVCIGDTNSLIAEFCLFDKPVITFRVPQTERTMPDIIEMIEKISLRIDTFEEVKPAIQQALKNPNKYSLQRKELVKQMIGTPDGKAGSRAANEIIKLIPRLKKD